MRRPDLHLTATLGAAVLACSLVAVWLWAVPAWVLPSTFAVLTLFVIGGATVSLLTWRNAQATSTIAQVLHDTEGATRSRREPISR